MKTTGTTIKLGIVWLVLSVFTVMIIVVFGQVRFRTPPGTPRCSPMSAGCGPGNLSALRA